MKNEQGFSLVELLIVVAIIAIIAAIAVPSLLTARQAANETGAIQGCRTAGSAEIAWAAVNNQMYTDLATLMSNSFLDGRFDTTKYTNGFNGYLYTDGEVKTDGANGGKFTAAAATGTSEFGILATPKTGLGRFVYGIGADQVVRYQSADSTFTGTAPYAEGEGIGASTGS